ncbi:c-type cytochrome biogenesis protein CcsB [Trichlorobacter ammonificans]|uniref:Heme exporter protein C n=2 Tax=Trichlorobacter ammonificans TaxID=2916410 RepID=A0ABN8HMI6_9BACT|nr:c-type cytochrome biogenesis protein CcsB [Trichlorobacter ammonificans]CAH2032375.1 HemX protein, negative effector of steady-state concentration of glutamyl-tRNA reductase [Trichlorobacter ammonificans]
MMTQIAFALTLTLYAGATLLYLTRLLRTDFPLSSLAGKLLFAGFCTHCLAVIHRFIAVGYLPITNMHEALSFFGLSIVGVYLVFEYRFKIATLGSFVVPLALLATIAAGMLPSELRPLNPALQSAWIYSHTLLAFTSYAFFTVSGCVAAVYLIQSHFLKKKHLGSLFQKLPSLDMLDEIGYRCLAFGFPLLTVAIITGAIWASQAWGSYWSWDPKETWSLITWFVYAALLHGRLTTGWRGRRAAWLTIVGFLIMLFTFIGVNLWLPGLHSYT